MLIAALIAIGLSLVSYGFIFGISLLAKKFQLPSIIYITILFLERGWIPPVEVFAFWTAIVGLLLKIPEITKEFSAFQLKILPDDIDTHYGVAMGRKILANIKSLDTKKQNLMLVNRVNKTIGRLVNTSDTSQMDDVLRTIGDVDRDVVDSSYSMVRYLIWLIPTLGFLGTVLGISLAIAEFPNLISNVSGGGGMEAIKAGLVEICKQLGVAFDTTLLALIMSAVIAYVMGLIRKKEDNLLSSIDEYCIENIVSRVVSIDAGSSTVLEGIKEAVKEMRLAIEEHGQAFQEKMDDLLERTGVRTGPYPAGYPANYPSESIPEPRGSETQIGKLIEILEDSRSEMQNREQAILRKIEQMMSAGERVSMTISEMKEYRNFSSLLEQQSRSMGDIQKMLSLHLETMDKTNVVLREAVGLSDQMEDLKKAFETAKEITAHHLQTVQRQEQILDKALTVNKNIGAIQGILDKNEKAMNDLSRVLDRLADLEERRSREGKSDKSEEMPPSFEGEIFLPEE